MNLKCLRAGGAGEGKVVCWASENTLDWVVLYVSTSSLSVNFLKSSFYAFKNNFHLFKKL